MTDTARHPEADQPHSHLERRTDRLNLRVTPTEGALIRQASERYGSITKFLVESARKEADQGLYEDRRTILSNEVFDRLAERLADDEDTVEALVELIRRPRRVQMPES